MIEVIFGIILGMGFAMFFPRPFERLKRKILEIVYQDHDCRKK